jgi:hypothetical protein
LYCQCPHCRATYNVGDHLAGTTAPCTACRQPFVVTPMAMPGMPSMQMPGLGMPPGQSPGMPTPGLPTPAWLKPAAPRAAPPREINWKPFIIGGGVLGVLLVIGGGLWGIRALMRGFLGELAVAEAAQEEITSRALKSMVILTWHDDASMRQMVGVAVRDGVVAVPREPNFQTTFKGEIYGQTVGPMGAAFQGARFLHADDQVFFFSVPVPLTPLPLSSEILLPGAKVVIVSPEGEIETLELLEAEYHYLKHHQARHPSINDTKFLGGSPLLSLKGEWVGLSLGTGIHREVVSKQNSKGVEVQVLVLEEKRTDYKSVGFVRDGLAQLGDGNVQELTVQKSLEDAKRAFEFYDIKLFGLVRGLQSDMAMHVESRGKFPITFMDRLRFSFDGDRFEGRKSADQILEELRAGGQLDPMLLEGLQQVAALSKELQDFNPDKLSSGEATKTGSELLARYRELGPRVASLLGVESQAAQLPTDERAREQARATLSRFKSPP